MTPAPDIGFDLRRLGWDDAWAEMARPRLAADLVVGRVAAHQRGRHLVLTEDGARPAELAGRLRRAPDTPAVGDWVAGADLGDRFLLEALLPRRTAIVRKAPGRETSAQVLAANVDLVAVVSSLAGEVNASRIERYLAAAWESGARPLVILTKADLRREAEATAAAIAAQTFAPVLAVSALSGEGLRELRAELAGDRTLALIGPSGTGKSTLVNRLLGEERQATHGLRRDGKGRHTTTHRELFLVAGGGVVVDTPGLRELGLWGAERDGADQAFADVVELAATCRFADCVHDTEPGCAVRAAVDEGRLDPRRLASYRKLVRELAWMEERRDGRAVAERRRERRRLERRFRRVSEGPWRS